MKEAKVKLRFKDLGEYRWLCYAEVPTSMLREFETWMKVSLPNCKYNKAMWKDKAFALGEVQYRLYEIRGGDLDSQSFLAMRWQ